MDENTSPDTIRSQTQTLAMGVQEALKVYSIKLQHFTYKYPNKGYFYIVLVAYILNQNKGRSKMYSKKVWPKCIKIHF